MLRAQIRNYLGVIFPYGNSETAIGFNVRMITLDIASVGQSAVWLGTTVTWLRKAAEELGIEPAARINGVDHYATDDVHRMQPIIDRMKNELNARQRKPARHGK